MATRARRRLERGHHRRAVLSPEHLPTVVALLKREAQSIGSNINPFDLTLRRPVQSLAALSPD